MNLSLTRRFGAAFICALACTSAPAVQPADVQITKDPGVTVTVTRRKANTSKTIPITVNQQDKVTVTDAHTNHGAGVFIDPDTTKWPKGTNAGLSTEMYLQAWIDPNGPWTTYQAPIPPPREVPASGDVRNIASFIGINRLDPIVYPGMDNMAHPHALFGLNSLTKDTTGANIRDNCVSSSRGGTLICSAYWLPAMIDTATHLPLKPIALLVYYKAGPAGYMGLMKNGVREGDTIQSWPPGLVMIAGSAASTGPQDMATYVCATTGGDAALKPDGTSYQPQASIPDKCPVPGTLLTHLTFPQCWDGVNLNSTDHKSHMAYPSGEGGNSTITCPADHPQLLPRVEFIDKIPLPADGDISKWVRASDVYAVDQLGNLLPGAVRGYSMHGDWMNGIKPELLKLWEMNCYKARADCGSWTDGAGKVGGEFGDNF
jgi:hypothetical protein